MTVHSLKRCSTLFSLILFGGVVAGLTGCSDGINKSTDDRRMKKENLTVEEPGVKGGEAGAGENGEGNGGLGGTATDPSDPSAQNCSVGAADTNMSSSVAKFTLNCSSGVWSTQCRVDENAYAPCSETFTQTGLTNGNHQFFLKYTYGTADSPLSGEIEPIVWKVTLTESTDHDAPTIKVYAPKVDGNQIKLKFDAADAGSGVASIQCTLAGGIKGSTQYPTVGPMDCQNGDEMSNLQPGTYTLKVVVTDVAGLSASASVTFAVDAVPVITPSSKPSATPSTTPSAKPSTTPSSVPVTSAPKVTGVTAASGPNAVFGLAQVFIDVTFDKDVTLTGAGGIQLALNVIPARKANYSRMVSNKVVRFMYQVNQGDAVAKLDYSNRNALTVPSGSKIAAMVGGQLADLTLPDPGMRGSISGAGKVTIDAIPPVQPTANVTVSGSSLNATFTSTDTGSGIAGYECVVGAPNTAAPNPVACATSYSRTGMAVGSYQFGVRAKDAAGNVSTYRTELFSIVPPNSECRFDDETLATNWTWSPLTAKAFVFKGCTDYSQLSCQLDDGPWTPCSEWIQLPANKISVSNQADGYHRFSVEVAEIGRPIGRIIWGVDTKPPVIRFTRRQTSGNNAIFDAAIESRSGVWKWKCRLDNSAWFDCAMPVDLNNRVLYPQSPGVSENLNSHTFQLQAFAGGLVQSDMIAHTWTAGSSTVNPTCKIINRPKSAVKKLADYPVTVEFSCDGTQTLCWGDGKACTSPLDVKAPSGAFGVTSTKPAPSGAQPPTRSSSGETTALWVADSTAPVIYKHFSVESMTTNAMKLRIGVTDAGGSSSDRILCSVTINDSAGNFVLSSPWSTCGSSYTVTGANKFVVGKTYVIKLTAVDDAGNPSAAHAAWTHKFVAP